MSRENRIISAAIQERGALLALSSVAQEEDFTRIGWALFCKISEYYENDREAQSVDVATLKDGIKVAYKKAHAQFFLILEGLEEVSTPNVVKEYLSMKEDGAMQRLAQALLSGSSREEISGLIDVLQNITDTEGEEDSNVIIGMSVEEALSAVSPENTLATGIPALDEALGGGLVRGSQSVIYAITEVGKSLLAIHIGCSLLRAGHKVLYVGNEDPSKIMQLRFFCNLSGMNRDEVGRSPKYAQETAIDNGYNNLVFLDAQPGSLSEVRRLVEKHSPSAMFIDQMANMSFANATKVEKNEELSIGLRQIAKKYNVASVIVHQADNDAHGKLVLDKSNMHFSNIGVQGQMDVMIGMGMDAQGEQSGRRMLTLCKNKNNGNHANIPIQVNAALSQVVV